MPDELITVLFLGDVIGKPGRQAAARYLRESRADFKVINGENMAGGLGITPALAMEMLRSGRGRDHHGQPRLEEEGDHPLSHGGAARHQAVELSARRAGVRLHARAEERQGPLRRKHRGPDFHGEASIVLSAPWKSSLRQTAITRLSWSISMPRRHRRRSPWAGFSTGGLRAWWARTPMFRPPTKRYCPRERAILPTWA